MDLRDEFEEIEEFLPINKILTHNIEKNDNILESFLRYVNLNNIDTNEFFDSIESHIKQAKELNKLLNTNIGKNQYILLLPGDSPTLFWYIVCYLYPNIKNYKHIIFPISSINNYEYEEEYEYDDEYIEQYHNDKGIFDNDIYIKKQKEENEQREKDIMEYDDLNKRQDNFLKNYLDEILKGINKNSKLLVIDYTLFGRSFSKLKETVKKLGFINKLDLFNIKVQKNTEEMRCIPSYTMFNYEKNENINNFKYTKCNILLYIIDNYLKNKKYVLNLNTKVKQHLKNFIDDIKIFTGKNVNIYYLDESEFIVLYNILLIKVNDTFAFCDREIPQKYGPNVRLIIDKIYMIENS